MAQMQLDLLHACVFLTVAVTAVLPLTPGECTVLRPNSSTAGSCAGPDMPHAAAVMGQIHSMFWCVSIWRTAQCVKWQQHAMPRAGVFATGAQHPDSLLLLTHMPLLPVFQRLWGGGQGENE
jgi:hypothetical protein